MRSFTIVLACFLSSVNLVLADNPFLGKWSLYLPDGAGWLEVREENGFLEADMLWIGGSVVPVSHVFMAEDKLYITRTSSRKVQNDDREHQLTTIIELQAQADQLVGKSIQPSEKGDNARVIVFYGKKIPDLPPAPDLSGLTFGEPVKLFNGRDLTGWDLAQKDRKNGWLAKDGVLTNNPAQNDDHSARYGNLRTEEVFEDFNLTLEVLVPEGSNSGVYLRGIYEIQIMDSYGLDPDNHHMGALYSRITPSHANEKKAGEWQDLDITLCDRHLTVILNGDKIIDNQPVEGVTGGALSADQFAPGPIYLQGDHGPVMYRDILLRPVLN